MHLYKLHRTAGLDFDVNEAFVVAAENEQQARELAAGEAWRGIREEQEEEFWRHSEHIEITVLVSDVNLTPHVVLTRNNRG